MKKRAKLYVDEEARLAIIKMANSLYGTMLSAAYVSWICEEISKPAVREIARGAKRRARGKRA